MNASDRERYLVPAGDIGGFAACWYSEQLDSLREPKLGTLHAAGDTIIRFLWLRTFHEPVAVRVTGQAGHWMAIISVADGQGGYGPGRLVRRDTLALPVTAVDSLRSLIVATGYWREPARDPVGVGTDGAQWVFELMIPGRYGLRDRWSPSPPSAFRALGLWFIGQLRDPELTRYLY